MWYVYFLKSVQKRWHYVGSTNRLQERIEEHNRGLVQSTRPHRPLTLVFTKEFGTEKAAREYERKVKKRRIEKETIIRQIEQ